jgi:arylsulfatase A-like enzyme
VECAVISFILRRAVMPARASTIAIALKSMGYATGQFGKNHLGDLNKFLPTVHEFDEYSGYLYHLDAM